ncbi:hypothetical protein AB6A40_003560 [Gnathostoma spinigerum]|uniref:Uncharacterized protein n=1 Tax=Gnathostoma spinigerum TaxID=75299 RepID=A0ABD6EB32_9BILA
MSNEGNKRKSSDIIKYKVVFLGHQNGGKSSLISRFVRGEFDAQYISTIGIDFYSKTAVMGEQPVRLQIWDTAGQERFHAIIPSFLRNSDAAIIVYDTTSKESFAESSHWFTFLEKEGYGNVFVCLVGNKTDLKSERVIPVETGERLAAERNCVFIETSAASGENVDKLFEIVACHVKQAPPSAIRDQTVGLPSASEKSVEPSLNQSRCSC